MKAVRWRCFICISLSACTLDLHKLEGVSRGGSSALSPGEDAAEVESGAKEVEGGSKKADAGAFWWMTDAGKTTSSTCGSVGARCCTSSTPCSTGVCLRGHCAVYGGVYQTASGCSPACQVRGTYSGGCSCPVGFSPKPAVTMPTDCASASDATAEVTFCTAPSAEAGDWSGIWIETEDVSGCDGACIVPNVYTNRCSCPSGSVEIAVEASVVSSCSRSQSAVVGFCVSQSIAPVTFAGVYQTNATAAGVCATPNPITGLCSCPQSATDQRIAILGKSFHLCSL
jgi:hypothetical protein